jgi:hypothetical protein
MFVSKLMARFGALSVYILSLCVRTVLRRGVRTAPATETDLGEGARGVPVCERLKSSQVNLT